MAFPRRFYLLALGLALACLALLAPVALAQGDGPIQLSVDGLPVKTDVPPTIIGGRTLVPVRAVAEALGAEVDYEAAARRITVTKKGLVVRLVVGGLRAEVGGREVLLDVPPQVVSDRTMVPLRFIGEAFGARVEWIAATRTVVVERTPIPIETLTWTKDLGEARVVLGGLTDTVRISHRGVAADQGSYLVTVDLAPATVDVINRSQMVSDPLFRSIRLEQVDSRTARLSLELGLESPYSVQQVGSQVVVRLAYRVTGVHFALEGAVPVLNIQTSGPVPYETFPLSAPSRAVIDLSGATLAPSVPGALPAALNLPWLKAARTAQTTPSVVRVVLDLEEGRPYQVVRTAEGLSVRFLPALTGVEWQRLPGKLRVRFSFSGPVQPTIQVEPLFKTLRVALPQAFSRTGRAVYDVLDGTVDTIHVGAGKGDSLHATMTLPYYLGYELVSKPGDSQVVIDVVNSPVYRKKIFIDPGHGGSDPGAIGKAGVREMDVNLAVSLRLKELLDQAGALVTLSRTADEDVGLFRRPQMANAAGSEVFVSVHANSAANTNANGVETYFWTNNPQSRRLAELIQEEMVRRLGTPNRGVRSESFVVIREAAMPSALVEIGYLSNLEEEKRLADPGFQARVAEALKAALFRFFASQ